MTRSLSLAACLFVVGLATTTRAATIYDLNTAYAANENNVATQTNSSFGPFAVGYGNTLTGLSSNDTNPASPFTAFSPSAFNGSFAGNANTSGFNIHNAFSIPAVIIDNKGSAAGDGFSGLNPNEILLHPGGLDAQGNGTPIQNAAIQFIAPIAGIYTIVGDFRALAGGTRVDEIGVNGTAVYESTTAGAFSLTEALHAGDTIVFAVSQGSGGINSNSTGLTAVITNTTPEPSTFILAGLGLVGLFAVARRRRA